MSNQTSNTLLLVERGSAEGVAWTFPDQESLKPTLIGFKHATLADHQVRVKVLYFSVGDKQLDSLKSRNSTPAYEVVGVIQAIGEKVGMRKVGDIVGVGLIRQSCRNCKICWRGKEQLCKNAKISSEERGFSSHIQVSADWTFPIPNNIPLSETAPLLYSGVSAFNIVSSQHQRLKLQHDRKLRLAVLGLGPIGLMATKFAHHLGYEVTIFSEKAEDQKFLKENGVNFQASFPLDIEHLGKNTLKFDVVVVATVIPKEFGKRSIELSRRNGKLVFLTQSINELGIAGFSLVAGKSLLTSDQKEITGVRNGTKDNFYKMLELVAHFTSETNRSLLPICEHFNFTEIENALSKVKSSTAKYQCVVKVDEDIVSRFNTNGL